MLRKKNISWSAIKYFLLITLLILALFIFLPFQNLHENYLLGGCNTLENLNYSQRELCWYEQIKREIKKGGITRALGIIKRLYVNVPEFAQGCHDVMHLVGTEAYKGYQKDGIAIFGEETTYCGYGFYHGFIETMLYTKGDYSEVVSFCESANANLDSDIISPNAIYSCFHGIGHSAFEIHDERLWGNDKEMVKLAIETCEKVTKSLSEEKKKQCVTGVFNALGTAYSNDEFGLKMNSHDPVWICRTLSNIQYKRACFTEVSIAWIYKEMGSFDYDFFEAIKFIENINDLEGEKISAFGLLSDYTRLKKEVFDSKDFITKCRSVKNELFESCINGIVWGLLGWGEPGREYEIATSFCGTDNLSLLESEKCFSYFLPILNTLYSKEKIGEICNSLIPPSYVKYCNL